MAAGCGLGGRYRRVVWLVSIPDDSGLGRVLGRTGWIRRLPRQAGSDRTERLFYLRGSGTLCVFHGSGRDSNAGFKALARTSRMACDPIASFLYFADLLP